MATEGNGVFYFDSTMSGAPQLSGESGKLIAVLDACLVDGFGDELPVGWAKVYSDTYKAAYQSTDTGGTQLFLRVDDTPAQYPTLIMYEAMSGVDAGLVAPSPTSGSFYAAKSDAASAATRPWRVFADSRAFYFCISVSNDDTSWYGGFFGDINSLLDTDAYHCMLIAWNTAAATTSYLAYINNTTLGSAIARNYSQSGGGVSAGRYGSQRNAGIAGSAGALFPHPGNLFLSSDITVWEDKAGAYANPEVCRGLLPGAFSPLHAVSGLWDDLQVTQDDGHSLRLQPLGATGFMAFDVTGPWRTYNKTLVHRTHIGRITGGGPYGITGTVTENLVPGAYRVQLYDQTTGVLLGETWSETDGSYQFIGLDQEPKMLVATDHTSPIQTAEIADNVIPS